MKKILLNLDGALYTFSENGTNGTIAEWLQKFFAGISVADPRVTVTDITSEVALAECYAKRTAEYGTLASQMDEIYHDADAWKARISAVKAKYPKP